MVSRAKPRPAERSDSSSAAYLRALRWLMSRELSEAQIRGRLAGLGYSLEAIDPAVGRLLDERAIDDRRTAASVARAEARIKRHGPRRVLAKLRMMEIDREIAKAVVSDEFGEAGEEDLLRVTLDRRLRGKAHRLTDPRERRKMHAYLIRQGFSASAAGNAIRKAVK